MLPISTQPVQLARPSCRHNCVVFERRGEGQWSQIAQPSRRPVCSLIGDVTNISLQGLQASARGRGPERSLSDTARLVFCPTKKLTKEQMLRFRTLGVVCLLTQAAGAARTPVDLGIAPDSMDRSSALSLGNIREALIRQEDTIIFSLIERAQFAFNEPVYAAGGPVLPFNL